MNKKKLNINIKDSFLKSHDETSDLFVRQFQKGEDSLSILLVHGALEHSGRYEDLIHFLMGSYSNISLTVYDHVGHGKSGGKKAYVKDFDQYVLDFLKISETFFNKKSSKHIILCHSLGGLIALSGILLPRFKISYPLHGLILSSPCIRPHVVLRSFSYSLAEKINLLSPKLHLPMIYSGKDLTSDILRANDFETDPLIPKFMSAGMLKAIFDAGERIKGESYYLNTPSLFLVSGDDKIVDSRSTLRFTQGIEKKYLKLKYYEHLKHELWNEKDRFIIFEDMKLWIDQFLKPEKTKRSS